MPELPVRDTMLVFDPGPAPLPTAGDAMAPVRVPIESLRANMEVFLAQWDRILHEIGTRLGSCQVEHVDLEIGLAIDGSIGLFGTTAGSEAKGGIKIRLKFDGQQAQVQSHVTK